jgi:hypothetical protein
MVTFEQHGFVEFSLFPTFSGYCQPCRVEGLSAGGRYMWAIEPRDWLIVQCFESPRRLSLLRPSRVGPLFGDDLIERHL